MHSIQREKKTHGTHGFPFQIYPSLQTPESELVPYHWHPENEFITIERGEVGLTIGDTHYNAHQGETYFVNTEQLHEIRGGSGNIFHAFVFPLDFLQFTRADLAQSELLAPLEQNMLLFSPVLPAASPIAEPVSRALKEILEICREQKTGYQLYVKSILLRIIALAAREGLLYPRQHSNDFKSNTLREVIGYLDNHCTEHLTLPQVAARFHLSPQYFCTFFKENLGRTLTQHINFLRIERASRLLRETDMPIMDIGMTVGFDNFSYFIKRFKEYYGCTPSLYRKSNHS